MNEQWRAISGYEGYYEASTLGRVRSITRVIKSDRCVRTYVGIILKPAPSPSGYLQVRLSRDGRSTSRTVHTIILETFVGPRPAGLVACHTDDNKANNTIANLRWDTPSGNARDRVRNGRDGQATKTHCKRGHEFTPENTYVRPKGRDCKTCRSLRNRKSRERAMGRAA